MGDAHIPLDLLGEVEVLTARTKRRAMGPDLDPMAFVAHRGWVGPMLRVAVDDPDDPTPYWLFSVRHAEELAGQAALSTRLGAPRAGEHPVVCRYA